MTHYATEQIRNVALVGHAGSGKTTLTETLLFQAGELGSPGSVEKGNTVSDYDPLEQSHQHSINTSVVKLDYRDTHINLIDCPGYPDFLGTTISALAAVETVALVIDAQATAIDGLSRRLMEVATSAKNCRMIIINKIDAEQTDLPAMLTTIQETFGKECLPLTLPAEGAGKVVDCFFKPSGESDFSSVADAHTALVDQVVEVDEKLMEIYLEQGEIAPEQLHDPFEEALRDGHIIPVCFVSARSGAGIKELLDVFVKLAPNPLEGNPHPFLRGEGKDQEDMLADALPEDHVLAHVFKVDYDPFTGKTGVFRIHHGNIDISTPLFVDDGHKAIRVSHLFRLQGKEHVETNTAVPGDICAIAKIDEIHWDSILHNSHDEDHVHLKPNWFPAPMTGLALKAVRRGDEQKISAALSKLTDEDPCLTVERNASANETVLRGLGDLHLRIALEKMKEHFHVEVKTHTPSIPYRETITRKAEGHHRHKKQTGGAGQFGEVYLRVEPMERGTGFEFADDIVGGVIPNGFIPAVEKGIRQAMAEGFVAGYPFQDIRVSVYDGKYHAVDSNEVSFVIAARKAFLDAVEKAKPIVLEPIVDLAVTAPENNMGDVSGEISSRRGRITNTESPGPGTVVVSAQTPLGELGDFLSKLKSLTGGEGSYAMNFSHYDPVPPNVQQRLASEQKKQAAAS
jgi:elongation factor G